jgi:hypothetical protein
LHLFLGVFFLFNSFGSKQEIGGSIYCSLDCFLVRICSLLDSFLLETVHLGMDYVRIFMFYAFWKWSDITQRRCCYMECQLSRESSSRKGRCCFHSGHSKSRDRCSMGTGGLFAGRWQCACHCLVMESLWQISFFNVLPLTN